MNDNLSDKIIERIDSEHIEPLPRWRFVFLGLIFWLFATLSVIVGSFAVGAILFLFFDYGNHGLLLFPQDVTEILLFIPYLWLIVFALFLIIARISVRHTKSGYKYHLYNIIIISVLLSFIFGSILNFIGAGKATHEYFNKIPFYNSATYDSDEILEIHRDRLK